MAHSRHERPAMASAHTLEITVRFICIKCEEESTVEMQVDGKRADWLIRNKQRLGWVPEAKNCQEEEGQEVVKAHPRHERPAMAFAHTFALKVEFICIKCEEDGKRADWLIRSKQRLGWVLEAKTCQEEEGQEKEGEEKEGRASSHSWVASTALTGAPWPAAGAVPPAAPEEIAPARPDKFTAMAQAAQEAMQGRGQTPAETEARILTAMQADVKWINQQEGYWGDPNMVRCLGHRIHGNGCDAPLARDKTANALCKSCKKELTTQERDLRASRRV